MVLKGAWYNNLSAEEYDEIVNIFEIYHKINLKTEKNEAIKLRERALQLLKGEQNIHYICWVCMESRKIEQICDIYYPKLKEMKED